MSFVEVERASVRSFRWVFIVYPDVAVLGFSVISGIPEISEIKEILACTYCGMKMMAELLSSSEKSS